MARDIYQVEADVDAVAEAHARAEGLSNALVIVTTIVLLGAFLVMQQALKKHFSAGLFGGATQESPATE